MIKLSSKEQHYIFSGMRSRFSDYYNKNQAIDWTIKKHYEDELNFTIILRDCEELNGGSVDGEIDL